MTLAITSQLPRSFRILPVGSFSAHDGRKNGNWVLPASRGQQIAALSKQRLGGFLIDYEHASLKHANAPEAGRFETLEWRDDGLYVVDASWSDDAKLIIAQGQKRFISPVFHFNPSSGEVLGVESIALTNNPALLGLTDLSQVAIATAEVASPDSAAIENQRFLESYERIFGGSPEGLEAKITPSALPPAPEGVTAEEWAKLHHVFGDLLHGQS